MTEKKLTIHDEMTEFFLYTAPGGGVKVEVFLRDESIRLPQKRMAELFGVQRPAITKHLKNIFDSGELQEKVVGSILEHTTAHCAMTYTEVGTILQNGNSWAAGVVRRA